MAVAQIPEKARPTRRVFTGEICGFGTTSGHRIIVGRWSQSPFGPFTDVMHESPVGWRTLRAPTPEIAAFVQTTYTFDEIWVGDVQSECSPALLTIEAGDLRVNVALGSRTWLGWVLHAVPSRIERLPLYCAVIDPLSRLFMRGVRTRGTAGNGRREWYGATDMHRVVAVDGVLAGVDLGAVADVDPPVRFGFSSTPRRPSVVAVTTTIEES